MTWQPLQNITAECSQDYLKALMSPDDLLIAVWQSDLYEVYEYVVPASGTPGGKVTWLSIKRRDKDAIRDWRHFQQIKNEICGPEREAVEVFPAESRLHDTANQYHLWVLDEGVQFPFGFKNRAVANAPPEDDRLVSGMRRQRPFEEGLVPKDAILLRRGA